MLNVKLISMNYENVYRYLCFCRADAVDCWGEVPRPVDSRLRGNDGEGIMRIYRIGTMRCIVCGYCLEATMTDPGRRPSPLDCGSSPQ